MTRYIEHSTQIVASSEARSLKKRAIIPPFSFTGDLEVGVSGYWCPTSTMAITAATVTASGPGNLTTSLLVAKREPSSEDPIALITFNLGATKVKSYQSFKDPIMLYPTDKVFIASFNDSGHTGIVLQMVGHVVTGL
jgi:L-lysine 2,3-aminomutase